MINAMSVVNIGMRISWVESGGGVQAVPGPATLGGVEWVLLSQTMLAIVS